MKSIRIARFLCLAFAIFLTGACGRNPPVPREKLVTRSELTITVGDREIRASIAGTAIIKKQDESAIISTETHRFTIERERVLVNGSEIARLPAEAKLVLFTIADGGGLTIQADGAPVEITKQIK